MEFTKRLGFGAGLLALLVGVSCDNSPTEVFETTPNFTLTINTPNITANPGENVLITTSLARADDFAGPVTLTAERLPGGVTADSDVIEPDEETGRVTVRIPLTATAGTTRSTIRAASAGAGAHVVPFNLTILPRSDK